MSDTTTDSTPRQKPPEPGAMSASVRAGGDRLPRPPVSVVIMTQNEESNIGPSIRSCRWWCDDIHVLDSGSTDRTVQIARDLGATVHVHPFKSFSDQRNWAIDNIPCRHPWHFHIDAEERLTPRLVEEMARRLGPAGAGEGFDAYQCPTKVILFDRWLRWSGGYPDHQVRLFRAGKCRFLGTGDGQRQDCQGPIGTIDQPYERYGFSRSLAEWFYKQNAYATREAAEGLALRRSGWKPSKAMWRPHSPQRRREWKNVSYSMKLRWFLRFLHTYVLRLGFLDGRAGLRYSLMLSTYEYWIELKMLEQTRPWRQRTEELATRMLNQGEGGRR